MAKDTSFPHTLEAAKKASVAQLLFKCARLVNERAIATVNGRRAGPVLRPSHTALFPHVDLEGTRLTELARRLGVTKQAASQLVDELEAMGVLERVPDPKDGRAKLVRFSRRGRAALLDGLSTLRAIEADLEARLGKRAMKSLHATLLDLERVLEE